MQALQGAHLPPLQDLSEGIFFLCKVLVVCLQTLSSLVVWQLSELQACFLQGIVVAVDRPQQLIFELAKYTREGARYGTELCQDLRQWEHSAFRMHAELDLVHDSCNLFIHGQHVKLEGIKLISGCRACIH